MKNKKDPRHNTRILLVQQLFASSFIDKKSILTNNLFNNILKNKVKLDNYIHESATQFPVEKIAKIDLAILRLAIYELLLVRKEPAKVIIDEAIEIAKEFGGEGSPTFINGVLGTLYKKYL